MVGQDEEVADGPLNCSRSELSTYLQALAAGFAPTSCWDTCPSQQLRLIRIVSKSYQTGRRTVCFHGFQFLEMSRRLTDDLGEDSSTWWRADSLVKTSVRPAKAKASKDAGQDSGASSPASLGKWIPRTCSWKTPPSSQNGDSTACSVTWPACGTMRSGVVWERTTLAPLTDANASGSWPTPKAYSYDQSHTPGLTTLDIRVRGLYRDKARYWPTPMARDWKERGTSPGVQARKSPCLPAAVQIAAPQAGGLLNPRWVEWLMGWPIGWTSCEPLEMAKFLPWRQQRGPV